ncbi:hypothetical protein [Nostoc sp.]|uniref:hypothetical protein n=1 Tax=Nostoc sp. TaxID=1180 RepID=UPI002FFBE9E7
MGHWALGMGHRAWGIGHLALVILSASSPSSHHSLSPTPHSPLLHLPHLPTPPTLINKQTAETVTLQYRVQPCKLLTDS